MPTLNLDLTSTEIELPKSSGPLPAGWYSAMIVDSIEKPTKAGTGSYIELSYQIVDGEFANRRIWDRLNLNNPNETAVRIAQQTLAAICDAAGKSRQIAQTEDLHDVPMQIRLEIKDDATYGAKNEIRGYRKASGSVAARAVAQAAAQPAATSKPSWMK
jgi:hypothetical protein